MKINQYAIYRVNNTPEGRKMWRHSFAYVKQKKLQIIIENYHQLKLSQFSKGDTVYGIWKHIKEAGADAVKGEEVGVSDVLVINRDGEISCYYIDKESLHMLTGFIRVNASGAVITVDTENYQIDNFKGEWKVTDMLILLGNEFYLMENQKYGKQASSMVLDAYGKVIIEKATRFDEDVKQKIRKYLEPKEPKTAEVSSQQKRLLNWQKVYQNGEYLRNKESGTEQNYDTVDGAVNNQKKEKNQPAQKADKSKKRGSVLLRLHQKQIEVAKKSGKPVPAYLQDENLERNPK